MPVVKKRKRICPSCLFGPVIKHGKTASGAQRYRCKRCNRTHLEMSEYQMKGCQPGIERRIIQLAKYRMRAKTIAGILQINIATVRYAIGRRQTGKAPRHLFAK